MKNKIRELTDRNKGISNEVRERKYQEYVRGWVEYFKLADMKGLLKRIGEWARRRIRAVYWKQWKKITKRYKALRQLGVSHEIAFAYANTRKGYYQICKTTYIKFAINTERLRKRGLVFLLDQYEKVHI